MKNSYFPVSKIPFEGPTSRNPLAFKQYNAEEIVEGKTMREHLRFAVVYWHTFRGTGSDPFGVGTMQRPWDDFSNSVGNAQKRARVAFEFIEKLGAPYYCWHDRDVAPEGRNLAETNKNFDAVAKVLKAEQQRTGIKLLWGTANLFSHPRYAAGAATNPDPEVFAWAALQVRDALEATHRLGGANYVLWGGREGYDTLLNTNLRRELDNLGRFLAMVVEHKHKIGFAGTILIEPKPHEPTKHQYDFDTATVYGFLQRYGLEQEVKVNIEANHATLSGHTFEHEIAMAAAFDIFGSIDANRGDPQNGWDTDQFPNSVEELTLATLEVLRAGGFTTGGFNFDAKVRRQSLDAIDLVHGHVGAIDVVAQGLLRAAAIIEDGRLDAFKAERYAGWDGPVGQALVGPKSSLAAAADLAIERNLKPQPRSGRQEMLENLANRF